MNYNQLIFFSLLFCSSIMPILGNEDFYKNLLIQQASLLISEIKKSSLADFTAVVNHFDHYCTTHKKPVAPENVGVQGDLNRSEDSADGDNRMPPLQSPGANQPIAKKITLTPEQIKNFKSKNYHFRKMDAVQGLLDFGAVYAFDKSIAAAGVIFATKMIDQDIQEAEWLQGEPISDGLKSLRKMAFRNKENVRMITWLTRIGILGIDKEICTKIYSRTCTCADCIALLAGMTRSLVKDRLAFHLLQDGVYTKLLQKYHDRPDYRFSYQEVAELNESGAHSGGCC